MTSESENMTVCWFAMRDLKRSNAKLPAWKLLKSKGFEVFTPFKWRLRTLRNGTKRREKVPYMQDLLFVRSTRCELDPIVGKTPTLQYRFVFGSWCEPMIVRNADMERFIAAVSSSESALYYRPDEITPAMCGRSVRIVGGPLDGYEGKLLKIRGLRIKRLLIELPNLLTVGVEVNPEYVQLL